MADQLIASEVNAAGREPAATDGRAQFVAPVVEDLGRLQSLTQQFSL
jgi:hypothetical protein